MKFRFYIQDKDLINFYFFKRKRSFYSINFLSIILLLQLLTPFIVLSYLNLIDIATLYLISIVILYPAYLKELRLNQIRESFLGLMDWQEIEILEDKLINNNNDIRLFFPYTKINEIADTKNYIYILDESEKAVIIPVKYIENKKNIKKLKSLLKNNIYYF